MLNFNELKKEKLTDNTKANLHHGKLMLIAIIVLSALLYLIFDVHAESQNFLTVSIIPPQANIGITVDDNGVVGGIAHKMTNSEGSAKFIISPNVTYTVTIAPTSEEFVFISEGDYNLTTKIYKTFLTIP